MEQQDDRLVLLTGATGYQRFVARRIADGVRRAVNLVRPAEIAFATVDVPEHVHNRRWRRMATVGGQTP
jgi:hypothetical protein